MSKRITFAYNKPTEELFKKVKLLIKNQNGWLNGNDKNGEFEINTLIGTFKGKYDTKNGTINVLIEKKPFLISLKKIESEVVKFLSQE